MIPQNGNGDPPAFGYGLLTTSSALAQGIIVSTTHKGVLDSATQNGNANNPIFYNHFITLKYPPAVCPRTFNAAVDKITFQSPGRIIIQSADAIQARIPNSFTGSDAITGDPLTLTPGNNVVDAVSFKLDAIFEDSDLSAVCVTIIDIADRQNELFVR